MSDRRYSPLEKLVPPVVAIVAVVALSVFGAPNLAVIPLGLAGLAWALWVINKHFPTPTENKEFDV